MNITYERDIFGEKLGITDASPEDAIRIIEATLSCDQQHEIDAMTAKVASVTEALSKSNTALQGAINQQEKQ